MNTTTTTTTLIKSQHFFLTPIKTTLPNPKSFNFIFPISPAFLANKKLFLNQSSKYQNWVIKSSIKHENTDNNNNEDDDLVLKRRLQVFTGAASIGLLLIMMGQDRVWALGPEGPLMEEFWENVRRYALYALTVSTGVIYTILQPIVELLKNPISAILIVVIIGGSFYIVSQIVSAMVGVSDFSYQYAY